VSTNFSSSQLSLSIAPAAPLKRAATSAGQPKQFVHLSEAERAILRLKALVGIATNKSDFMSVLNAAGIRAPGGLAWSHKSLSPIVDRLMAIGLLKADQSCVEPLRHSLAAEMMAAPEGRKAADAMRRTFSTDAGRHYFSYSPQSDASACVRLRLAIYENDVDAWRRLVTEYDKVYSRALGPHILEELFAKTVLEVSWLATRDLDIQFRLFWRKLERFLLGGQPTADMPAILAHYRAREDRPDHAKFKWELLRVDILEGRLASVRRKIESMPEAAPETAASSRFLLLGSLDFLEGQNDEALFGFRQALKLYKKEVGKRKLFFNDSNGLFFLLGMIRTNDSALHAEIQTHLDAVDYADNPFSGGFRAIQAMLFLLRGLESKARTQLGDLQKFAPHEPLSAALVALVEFFVNLTPTKAQVKDNQARLAALAETLPLVARIHAEILAQISDEPALYKALLCVRPDGGALIAFAELVKLQQQWERSFDSLANFLSAGTTAPVAAPVTQKSRRLVWLVDPELKLIEVVEQSAKGVSAWTSGRSVAMKRLYEQDPRLDYLSDHDRRALRTIRKTPIGSYGQESYEFDPYATLLVLVDHPLVFDFRNRDRRLQLVAYPVELVASEHADGYRFALSHWADTPTVFLEAETPTRLRIVDFAPRLLPVQEILGKSGLLVPRQGRERVLSLVRAQHPSLPIRTDIIDADVPAIQGRPEPVFQIQPLEEGLQVTMVTRPFGPTGPFYLAGLGGQSVLATIDGARQRCNRDLDAERRQAQALLAELPMLERREKSGHEWVIDDTGSALEFLLQVRQHQPPILVEWPEGKKLAVRAEISASSLSLKIARARDWFQMDGEVSVDSELVLDMRDLLSRLERAQGRFVPLADGSFLALTEQFRKQLERVKGISEDHGRGRRLPVMAGIVARELAEDAGLIKADKEWKGFVERLSAANRRQPEPPSTLQAELRDYQLEGFRWLSRLAHWQAGACLADDMGLGKTVQAIGAMLEQSPNGPCLVIAPTSVCHNWEKELSRFAPSLAVHRLGAVAGRAAVLSGLKAMDVLILSYGLLHQEADQLANIDWRMVVFDEAQAIKNAETRRAQAGQRLKAHFRVALTGTPIENYLDELWSLFAIVNPGLLGSRESFGRRFGTPIERNRDAAALNSLRTLIRPFILRRTKSAVLSELPPRTELMLEIDLPDDERAFYEAMRLRALEALAELPEKSAGGQNRIHILAEITKLRRACCHPGLVDPATAIPGAKLQAFLDLVDDLIRNRHKALVFSQFVGQLERVREALVARGIAHQYLDGGTPSAEREKRVSAFQAGHGDLFLISLKAGGTGLNLTAADYVIHLDPWWNPAVEDQASDRAHRIGQQRPVTVYRLIVRDSIEEKILDLHRSKRNLASDLLEGAEVSARLSEDDLLNLIRA
jgi:superfamily II DNA or RNA helicase